MGRDLTATMGPLDTSVFHPLFPALFHLLCQEQLPRTMMVMGWEVRVQGKDSQSSSTHQMAPPLRWLHPPAIHLVSLQLRFSLYLQHTEFWGANCFLIWVSDHLWLLIDTGTNLVYVFHFFPSRNLAFDSSCQSFLKTHSLFINLFIYSHLVLQKLR